MYVQSAWVSILVLTTGLLSSRQSEKIKNEKDGPFDANKYFYIIKMGLELKVSKLTESLLYIIQVSNPSQSDSQKLISYEFLDGNCEDNCVYTEESKPPPMNGRHKRKLIDAVVESICQCVSDRDNQVQL